MYGKTHSTKTADVEKKWILIDAKASSSAGSPRSSRCGCAASIRRPSRRISTMATTSSSSMRRRWCLTGRKREDKVYYHYSGFQGGIKERTAKFILEGRFPERIIEKAVERMLPRGPLGRKQLGNLRVYKGAEHPHEAQSPTVLDVASFNRKNARSA